MMIPNLLTSIGTISRFVYCLKYFFKFINFCLLQNISDEKFDSLFEALEQNTHLETLSLANVGLTDRGAEKLAQALEKNNTVRVLNVETNLISPSGIVRLIKSFLKMKAMEEFRASNQVCSQKIYIYYICFVILFFVVSICITRNINNKVVSHYMITTFFIFLL